ncbi:hypothetical protein NTD89_15310 [Pseudomonas sp. 14P_5.3_Bac1]|jgi:hypothetical protein|uniref:hypothetical protein n=1 Tax=Pseudomonas TaxID=286 RepID=UPI0021C6853A|nr:MULTISPECIES: hypothetical protein [Pseudomonas]MCU1778394.1 hypothetical protein [Pseudomonas sp. 14P_5.3_Bac1]MDF3188431.1 hypothetical protein [Pseudomonas paracarnis]
MPKQSPATRARRFPWNIDYTSVCDVCGRWRAQGNHEQCSRQRQRLNAHLRNHKPKP